MRFYYSRFPIITVFFDFVDHKVFFWSQMTVDFIGLDLVNEVNLFVQVQLFSLIVVVTYLMVCHYFGFKRDV